MTNPIERENEFFQALGAALERWQWVEQSAYLLYSAFMQGADRHLISVTFHHIQSFDSRISLLHRCAHFAIKDETMTKRWDDIRKRMTDQCNFRNRIVHFTYSEHHKDGITTLMLKPSSFNAVYAIRDKWKNPDSEIQIHELVSARQDFRKLAGDLDVFRKDVIVMAENTDETKEARSEGESSENGK